MTRKFLFCFPLIVGNIVFGYVVIVLSVSVILYNLCMLGLIMIADEEHELEAKFRNWENLEQLFGRDKESLVIYITLLYHTSYVFIAILLVIFASMFVYGISKGSRCLVSTFFVYSFIHLMMTLNLLVWEATSAGYFQLCIILVCDVLLMLSLFGVKYLMEDLRLNTVYSRPGKGYTLS